MAAAWVGWVEEDILAGDLAAVTWVGESRRVVTLAEPLVVAILALVPSVAIITAEGMPGTPRQGIMADISATVPGIIHTAMVTLGQRPITVMVTLLITFILIIMVATRTIIRPLASFMATLRGTIRTTPRLITTPDTLTLIRGMAT